MIVRLIETCGRHPFATGLLSLLGVFGLVFSVYGFSLDRSDAESSRQQVDRVQASIDQLGSQLRDGVGPQVPQLYNLPYPIARRTLIEEGWNPKRNHPSVLREMGNYSGNAKELWDAGYWENEHCFSTGDAACQFRFFDPDGNILLVSTAGTTDGAGNFDNVRVTGTRLNPDN